MYQLTRMTYSTVLLYKASSYIGMTMKTSVDLSKIYISQQGHTQRIICDFLPDKFPAATFPAPSHFNHLAEDKPYDRIKYLSIIMTIINVARLARPDVLLATANLVTKAQHPKEGDYKAALRIISYLQGTPIVVQCRERTLA